jgi:ankyrin repeat protein
MVSLLMDHSANLSYQNEHGNTALHEAVMNNHHSEVKKIVSGKGRKVLNQVNYAGETPLIVAAKYGKLEAMLRLLAVCPEPDKRCKAINGVTALDYAKIKFGFYHPIMKVFDSRWCASRR